MYGTTPSPGRLVVLRLQQRAAATEHGRWLGGASRAAAAAADASSNDSKAGSAG